ncbi:MAG: hypothetical protein M3125_02920 [Gemmatimonadota bacterium]|nr:hypothetical protein [Gemmatimonadota bacterium]
MNLRTLIVVAGCVLVVSCGERAPESRATPPSCDVPEVRQVVERFGERLQRVSLLAADSVVIREMRDAYAPFVTPELLSTWTSNPRRAPGRELSSPWPARIAVRSVQAADAGGCRVEGDVVYESSAPAAGDSAMRQSVTMVLREADGWRIVSYTPTSQPSASNGGTEPADVLREYYAAINAGDYRSAYALWENGGAASDQTYDEFAAGFAETRSAQVDVGTPGRVEGAAGSRYVEIPVTIRAVTKSGENQRFEGTYVLRRSVVDGAPPEQRRWHIYRATLRAT